MYIYTCKYNDEHVNMNINKQVYIYINKQVHIWSCQNSVTVDSIKVKHEEPL